MDRTEADGAGVAAEGVPLDGSGGAGPGRTVGDGVADSGAIEAGGVDGIDEELDGVVGVRGGVVGEVAEADLEGGWKWVVTFV